MAGFYSLVTCGGWFVISCNLRWLVCNLSVAVSELLLRTCIVYDLVHRCTRYTCIHMCMIMECVCVSRTVCIAKG